MSNTNTTDNTFPNNPASIYYITHNPSKALLDAHKQKEIQWDNESPKESPYPFKTTESFKSTKGFDTARGNSKKLRRKKKKKTQNKRKPNKIDSRKKFKQKKHKSTKNKKKMYKSKKNRKGRGNPRSYKKPNDAAERTIIDLPEQNRPLNEHIDVINNLIDHNEELKNIFIHLRYSHTPSTDEKNNIRRTMYLITNRIKQGLPVIKNKLTNADNTYNEEIKQNFEEYNQTIYSYIELNYKKDNESLIDKIKTLGKHLLTYNINDQNI